MGKIQPPLSFTVDKTSKFQTVYHDPFEINFNAHNLAFVT